MAASLAASVASIVVSIHPPSLSEFTMLTTAVQLEATQPLQSETTQSMLKQPVDVSAHLQTLIPGELSYVGGAVLVVVSDF